VHVSSNAVEEEREEEGQTEEGKKLIPWITKNKARVDGKLFSNGLRQGLSSYVIYCNLARYAIICGETFSVRAELQS